MDSKSIVADKRKTPGFPDIDRMDFEEDNPANQKGGGVD